jgi:hypothetical protein
MKTVLSLINIFLLQLMYFAAGAFAFQQHDNKSISKANISFNTGAIAPSNNSKNNVTDNDTNPEPGSSAKPVDTSFKLIDTRYNTAFRRLKTQAAIIKDYAKRNNYNLDYCFLIDMSLPSGKKRFFIYNLKNDSMENAALVSHGFGSYKPDCDDVLVFSNTNFSFKTSIGKYKIGGSYKGAYGLAYKLYGLDSTNSKALERAIVLHSDLHIPETETYPFRIFQSAGCPAVAPAFLTILGNYIKPSKKPVLMWIYN